MLSCTSRLKNICSFITYSVKVTLGENANRQFITSKILFSNKIDISNLQDSHNSEIENSKSFNTKEGFGTIIGLDPNEVEVDEKYLHKRKSKRKKNVKVATKTELNNEKQDLSVKNEKQEEKNTCNENKNSKIIHVKNINLKSIGSILSNLKSKKQRLQQQKIFLEGKKLISDVISAGYQPLVIFYSRKSHIENFNLSPDVKLCRLPYKNLQMWSDVVTTQGVLGVFQMPNLETIKENPNSLPFTVICDNIKDPGNMGSIIRILAAVGCKKLLVTKGCVDIWESKVLRASAGAHFKLPIKMNLKWDDIEIEIPDSRKIFLADSGYLKSKTEKGNSALQTENEFNDSLPLKCYDSVNYQLEEMVLVVGSEAEGLSEEAYFFAKKRQGVRVFIPMSNEIESINNSVALGILSFEVKRQLKNISQ